MKEENKILSKREYMNRLLNRNQVKINPTTCRQENSRKMANQDNSAEQGSTQAQDQDQAQASTSRSSNSITRSLRLSDITKSFREFNGTGNIHEWIRLFNDQCSIFNLTPLEKFVFAKKLITGAAELFVRYESRAVQFEDLMQELKEEYGAKVNSALTYEKLRNRKMKKEETPTEYLYEMLAIAEESNIDVEAVITYTIQGLPGTPNMKNFMFEATTIKEFKKKLLSYEIQSTASKTSDNEPKPSTKGKDERHHCYNCGELHQTTECPNKSKGPRCFKCNNFGHRSGDNLCPSETSKTTVGIIKAERIPEESQEQDIDYEKRYYELQAKYFEIVAEKNEILESNN